MGRRIAFETTQAREELVWAAGFARGLRASRAFRRARSEPCRLSPDWLCGPGGSMASMAKVRPGECERAPPWGLDSAELDGECG